MQNDPGESPEKNDSTGSQNFFPDEPLTQLASSAAEMHETFMSYVTAGFTEEQAMQLILAILVTGIQHGLSSGE